MCSLNSYSLFFLSQLWPHFSFCFFWRRRQRHRKKDKVFPSGHYSEFINYIVQSKEKKRKEEKTERQTMRVAGEEKKRRKKKKKDNNHNFQIRGNNHSLFMHNQIVKFSSSSPLLSLIGEEKFKLP